MPRCGHCGRGNPAEAVFCQDCGSRIDVSPPPDAGLAPGESGGKGGGGEALCGACGATNPEGMSFCRSCGARVAQPPAGVAPSAEAAEAAASAKAPRYQEPTCPRCGEPNASEFKFCQQCGSALRSPSGGSARPTPPSGIPVSTATPAGGAPSLRSITPMRLGSEVKEPASAPVPAAVPHVNAGPLLTASGFRGVESPSTPAGWPDQAAGTIGRDRSAVTPVSGPGPAAPSATRPLAKLVAVNRDGSDGVVYPVTGERFDIGRRTGTLLFEDDGYLSERHLRIELREGTFVLVDLDSLNGVFVRIRNREELHNGTKILLGMELLRFDLVPEHERDPAPAMEHGVLVFGTPPKLPWARLRQLTTAGIIRDTYHLYRAEVVLGRESGDIVFSDDDFMSRMHAAVRNEGGKAWLVDLNSSNGTYLQVRGERALVNGDFLRLGDQLLRFEEL